MIPSLQTRGLAASSLALLLAAGGSAQAAAQSAAPTPTVESPFGYCARVGTDDRSGVSGDAVDGAAPAALAPHLHEALRLPRDAVLAANEMAALTSSFKSDSACRL
jgi:hypothetical protein